MYSICIYLCFLGLAWCWYDNTVWKIMKQADWLILKIWNQLISRVGMARNNPFARSSRTCLKDNSCLLHLWRITAMKEREKRIFKDPSLSTTVSKSYICQTVCITCRKENCVVPSEWELLEGMLNEINKSVFESSHVTSPMFPGQHQAGYISSQQLYLQLHKQTDQDMQGKRSFTQDSYC